MQTKLVPQRQRLIGRMCDAFMVPVMYLLQGNFREIPQRTHLWNNLHLHKTMAGAIDPTKTVQVEGRMQARSRWLGPIPVFHMPIFGGWKKFVVLEPAEPVDEWFVGWIAFDAFGISKIPLTGPVRLGVAPQQTRFFGFTADGTQINLVVIGEGLIGKAGEFSTVPLL